MLSIIEENTSNRKQSSISYDSNIPPTNFTYKKIVKMFYSELLKREAIKLENNAKAIAKEIAIKIKKDDKTDKVKKNLDDYSAENIINAFKEIIEKKIKDCIDKLKKKEEESTSKNKKEDELLRKNLWDVLYKVNFGYVETLHEYPDKTLDDYLVTNNNYEIQDKLKQDQIYDKIFNNFFLTNSIKSKNGGMKHGARTLSPNRRRRGSLPIPEAQSMPRAQSMPHAQSMPRAQSMPPAQSMPQAQSMDNEFYENYFSQQNASILQKIKSISRYFIIPWKNLFLKVYKELWFIYMSVGDILNPYQTDDFQRPTYIGIPYIHPIYNRYGIDKKRIELRDEIINSYKNDLDKQAIIKAKFEFIGDNYNLIDLANISIYKRILMDWRINFYKKFPDRMKKKIIEDHIKINYWKERHDRHSMDLMVYRPFDDVPIYGMRFQDRFDREDMLRDMIYLFRNIPDLKDCDTIFENSKISIKQAIRECNPYDRYAEHEIFEIAAKMYLGNGDISEGEVKYHESGIIYLSIKNFENMKAGNLLDWYQLSNIPQSYLNQRIIINSSNGKRTSGAIFLFLKLRDAQKDTEGYNYIGKSLVKINFGHNNIFELLKFFKDFFLNIKVHTIDFPISYDDMYELLLDCNEEIEQVADDLFNTKFIWHVKLLRQRLNRIFYFLAKKHNITEFYLYTSPRSSKYYQPTYDDKIASEKDIFELFSLPTRVQINWKTISAENWSHILEKHQNLVDGISEQHYYLT